MYSNLYSKTIIILSTSFCIIACNTKEKKEKKTDDALIIHPINLQKQEGALISHKKEFRYDYSVIGKDEKNRTVYGDLNLEAELGEGVLTTYNEPSIVEIVVESNQKGKIIARDFNGNKYYLKIK